MTYAPKLWIRLGLGAVLFGTASLAACGGEPGEAARPRPEGPIAETVGPGDEEAEQGEAALDPALLLPVEERVALISGRVAAADALARSGAVQDAATQLRLAITDIKPGGLPRLQKEGFDPVLLESAAGRLESGELAEAELQAVDEHMQALRQAAGGDAKALVSYLIRHCGRTYKNAVSFNNEIVDNSLYQESYGYAVMAREYSDRIDSDDAGDLRLELELLVRMWPQEGPLAGTLPAPLMNFASQISRIELALSTLQ